MAPGNEGGSRRESSRLQESGNRKKLEALEEDNFRKDPFESADSPKKKAPRLIFTESSPQKDQEQSPSLTSSKKKKRFRGDHFKTRFRKTFAQLLDEQKHKLLGEVGPNYFTAVVPPSKFPARKFCSVCGSFSKYNCVSCGSHFCSTKCLGTHHDTRCLKWTV